MPIALPLSTSGGELSWDDIPTPLMMMDHQGLVWAMNAAARPWFGVDAGNGIAISAMELMPALDMKALLTAALTNRDGDAAAGQVRSLGVTAITNAATGRQQVVELEAWGWRLGGGDSVTLALRDCTEHYARERRLRRQRHHFREVLRKAPIGLAICDAEGRFTAVNDALYAMVGRPAGELIGRPYTDLVVPDALDDALRDRAALLRGDGGNTLAREYLCQTGSGECTWLSLNLSVVNSWVDGGAPYFVAVVQDVSRLRESREMLVRAQKMDVVGQLSGGIAHDFNNLLTVVIGNLQLVLQNDDPLKRMVRLNSALEAAERGAALTKRLLTFSRNDNPQLQLLDINAAIAGLVVLLEQSVGTVASLEFRPGADIWPVRIDPGRFESALLNLAVNARDAMASGGQLVIETRNVRLNNDDPVALVSGGIGPGHFVELAVSDSGSGMPADVRDRIFEPFFTTKSAGSGTGLGLTMVQRFVSDAGGAIKVYSAPGQGTTFRIYLPRAQLRQGERDPSSAEYPILRRGSETILVVDDDAAVREVATTVLTTLGYRTLEAASGEEAIDILVAHKTEVDLLFTDVVMGAGMNGTELAAAAIRINPRLRVLYTSGYTKDAFVARVTAEPVELLSKPYLSAELAQRIREVLDR